MAELPAASPRRPAPGAPADADPSSARRWRWFALCAACLAVGIGMLRVVQQRQHPPPWAVGDQLFEGFVAIDGHAHRAHAIQRWLVGSDPAGADLLALLREADHSTAVAIPAATAIVGLSGLSIPWSYVLVVTSAFLLTLHLAGRLAQELGGPARPGSAMTYWSVWLYASLHISTTRTVALLVLDWGVACAAAGTALCALRWSRTGKAKHLGMASVALALGLFTKASALPLCLVPPILAFAAEDRRTGGIRRAAAATLAVLAPLALAAWFASALADASVAEREAGHMLANTRLRPLDFALEMALLFQVAPLALWLARPWTRATTLLAACVAIYCCSAWAFGLPSTARLYVPALALGVPLVVACSPERLARRVALPFAAVNLALAGIVLLAD